MLCPLTIFSCCCWVFCFFFGNLFILHFNSLTTILWVILEYNFIDSCYLLLSFFIFYYSLAYSCYKICISLIIIIVFAKTSSQSPLWVFFGNKTPCSPEKVVLSSTYSKFPFSEEDNCSQLLWWPSLVKMVIGMGISLVSHNSPFTTTRHFKQRVEQMIWRHDDPDAICETQRAVCLQSHILLAYW